MGQKYGEAENATGFSEYSSDHRDKSQGLGQEQRAGFTTKDRGRRRQRKYRARRTAGRGIIKSNTDGKRVERNKKQKEVIDGDGVKWDEASREQRKQRQQTATKQRGLRANGGAIKNGWCEEPMVRLLKAAESKSKCGVMK